MEPHDKAEPSSMAVMETGGQCFLWPPPNLTLLLQLKACHLSKESGVEVQHPLLDRVRQCSADPDKAAALFVQILSPAPHERREAMHGRWCADTVSRMFAETDSSYESYPAIEAAEQAEAADKEEAAKQAEAALDHRSNRCAALFSCFSCCVPSVKEDDVFTISSQLEEPVASVSSASGVQDPLGAAPAGSEWSQSSARVLQTKASVQKVAASSLAHRCWSSIKSTVTGRSKHRKQHVADDENVKSCHIPELAGNSLASAPAVSSSSLGQRPSWSVQADVKGTRPLASVSVVAEAGTDTVQQQQQLVAPLEQPLHQQPAAHAAPTFEGIIEAPDGALHHGEVANACRQQSLSSTVNEHRYAVCQLPPAGRQAEL